MNEKTFEYDICLSFSGEDREIAKTIAKGLRQTNISVFYDEYEKTNLVGKDLSEHLAKIYSSKSRFCCVIISSAYRQKKWTNNIELPAIRERLMNGDDSYVIPVLLDDTKLTGILDTFWHVDLRRYETEHVISLIAYKILEERYKHNYKYKTDTWKVEGFLRVKEGVTLSELLDLLSYYIYAEQTSEFRISTFTPLQFFENKQFCLTLEMLSNKMEAENRSGILRFYCLPQDQNKLENFCILSREPIEIPLKKLEQSVKLAQHLAKKDNIKQRLEIQFLHYDGLIPFYVFQVDNRYFFTSYRIGHKQDVYNLYYLDGMNSPQTFRTCLENIFLDLDLRTLTKIIN